MKSQILAHHLNTHRLLECLLKCFHDSLKDSWNDYIPNGILLYLYSPRWVLIVVRIWESSWSKTCWYALDRSSLEKYTPPDNKASISLIFGNGYKSPQSPTLPSCFTIGTTGVAQSEYSTLSIIPFWSNRLSSSSILCFRENGTGLAFTICWDSYSVDKLLTLLYKITSKFVSIISKTDICTWHNILSLVNLYIQMIL